MPDSVTLSRRVVRLMRAMPRKASSSLMFLLTAAWERCRSSAAALKVPISTTRRKTFSAVILFILPPLIHYW